jgi:hypothetical protein
MWFSELADESEQHNRGGLGSSASNSGVIDVAEENEQLGVMYFR